MEQPKPKSSARILIAGIVATLCCICLIALALGGYAYYYYFSGTIPGSTRFPLLAPPAATQTPVAVIRPPVESIPSDTISALKTTIVPDSDLYDLACRLKQICNVPHTLPAPAAPFKVGDAQKFWIGNVDTNNNFQISATLRYITPHTYFWAQDGVKINEGDMKKLMDAFENKIYPTDRQFFGSEWTPGVDNDPHIYIVYARGTGASNAGYFSTPDEYNPLVHKYSNGHEMFVFNADNMDLASPETYSVLAHEFQHMIRWHIDPNQPDWMNEGFSVLAEYLNGYTPYFDYIYITQPDLSLNDWLPDPGSNGPHYGESFLFLDYFLDRFGAKATQALAANHDNSLASVDDTLKNLNIADPQTGKIVSANDVVMDWMVTNYLKDGSVGDGRYVYHNYKDSPQASPTETISNCPQSALNRSVNQYGADYIQIACAGDHTLTFSGSTLARLLPTDPHSGKYAFWSNKGDSSDMTLTREFDLSNVGGPLEFSYWTWYDLEKGYDYLYLEASTDGGQSWSIIKTPTCFNADTSGNAYGCGYTGMSGGGNSAQWINEKVDLSQYTGKKVQLRFEYVTDAAVNGEGLLLDDLSITAIHYSSDLEADNGGWQANGFARIENSLPQTFRLALILKGDTTTVQNITLSADQTAQIPLSLKPGQSAVLVITGTQRFTRLPAGYSIEIK